LNNNGDISFYEDTGTTPKFFWDASAESLGIGTSSPTTALTVSTDGTEQLTINRADASISTGNTVGTILFTGDDPSANQTGARIQILAAENWSTNAYGSHITFSNDSSGTLTERMRIDSSGNVGIGTDSPSDKLNVLGGGASIEGSVSGFTGGEVRLGTSTSNTQSAISTYAAGTPQMYFDHRGTTTGQWIWRSSSAERMRIDSSGNVGIGTSSPSLENGSGLVVYNATTPRISLKKLNYWNDWT
jgi:hypothetical protein